MIRPPQRFNARAYLAAVARAVRENPAQAEVLYVRACLRLRAEAMKPENAQSAMGLQDLASQVEFIAAQRTVPPMGQSGEIPFASYSQKGPLSTTDLDQIVEDMTDSRRDTDGHPVDELIAAGRQSAIEQQRDQAQAPPVQITPLSAKPGTTVYASMALCQFGGASPQAANNTINAPVTGQSAYQETQVVSWEGRDVDTETVTVIISQAKSGGGATFPAAANGSGTSLDYRPYARIFFGANRGAPAEVIVDVGRGCQLTLATSFLSVNVGMDAPKAGSTNVPGSMLLGAAMGFFSSARQSPVVRTQYADNIAKAAAQTLVIPEFAASVIAVFGQNITNWTLSVQNANGTVLGTITASQLISNEVVLPNDAYKIVATNNGGGTDSIEIVYRLGL